MGEYRLVAVNEIYRVTIKQEFLSQELLNVFFVKIDEVDTPNTLVAVDVGFSLMESIAALWIAWVSEQLTFTEVYVENLTDGLSLGSYNPPYVGGVAGEVLPSYSAISVKLPRTSALTRSGGKRFAGVIEAATTGNLITASGYLDDVEAFAEQISAQFELQSSVDPEQGLAHCVLVGTNPETGQPNLTKVQDFGFPVVRATLSTQNSRKQSLI